MLTEDDHLALWDGEFNRWFKRRLNLRLRRYLAKSWSTLIVVAAAMALCAVLFGMAYFMGSDASTERVIYHSVGSSIR